MTKQACEAAITAVTSSAAPAPLGHYAQGVLHQGVLHVAGQLPVDPRAPGRVGAHSAFAQQMQQLLANCDAVLEAGGSGRAGVLSLTLYLTDLNHWEEADHLCAAFFGAHRPARTVLGVAAIRKGYAVQASMVAALAAQPISVSNR